MKMFMLLLVCAFTASFVAKGQVSTIGSSDTLVWHEYIGGKPDIRYVRAQEKVLRTLGIGMETFFGDCGGTFDYKFVEFEKKNVPVIDLLKAKLGTDWKVELNKLVRDEMKSAQD